MIWMLLGVGLLFGALVGYHQFGQYMMKKYLSANAAPPATVTAMPITFQTWQPEIRAVGSLRAQQSVEISPQIAGQIKKVFVRSGQKVKKGTLLIELDHDSDDARLQALQADARLAEVNYKRNEAQLKARAISQSILDESLATMDRTQAAVAEQKALIAKKRLIAPFSGTLGIVSVHTGQYLNPAQVITTLQNTSSLFVDFHLPQKFLDGLSVGQGLQIHTDAWPNETFKGRISAVDAKVDENTRNLHIEGLLENPEDRLQPGMFVSVRVNQGDLTAYLTLPQTAIGYNAYGATVFVAKSVPDQSSKTPALTAQQVFVKTGATRGDQVAILDGLHEGDLVVTSGLMKLKNGTPLIIDNHVTPANDVAPTPEEK
ncbi:MAG: efflux RND transporter periplasmic adaptor subunit [Gammaproteobacteria bacterium]|nr:MAG: efflux RND transporter periplasmic adaptor subunit [Gammaproteobacteria bacterium]